ncbi:MAG: hypothetical protein Q8P07_03040 [bacterium]|nr:hypothetical protein [bacterium]
MVTITIPQKRYQELVKKAQIFERFRAVLRENYPIETYSDARIKEFEKADKISPMLKKSLNLIIKGRA